MMKVEKQDSMGEGSRGLLHLFDWNVKSRKKLLLSTQNVSEPPKQKTSSNISMTITQYHTLKNDLFDHKSQSEDDSGKPMGVVARLMGLDSFPISNFSETHSNRFSNTHSIKIREFEQKDYQQIERKQRVIEKFQTETIPPKSAKKYVSITQHKLLSPVKRSGFVSSDDPIRITEATSKIPLVGSSSVPSSARKPSSRKPVDSNGARKLKGQSMNKSWDGCLERKQSVSLAVQAKVNIKKRESLSLNKTESVNSQPNRQKNTVKKPPTNSVLKRNNQKQNCLTDRGKSTTKSSVSSENSQLKKPVSEKSSNKVPVNVMNKNTNRRKLYMEDVKNRVLDKNDKSGKNVIKCNGSDIVSFTFTSPISRSTEKKNVFMGRNGLNLESGSDSLSTLLDKKLREVTAMSSVHTKSESTESVPGYVKNILTNIESMFDDFTLNRTNKIVNPCRFDHLEAQRPVLEKKHESKLRRRLVFDCVSECVDLKCSVWIRGLAVVRRKDQLVEEVCNDILRWEMMKECVVEEVVDKSMSGSQQQKWLDFDFEVFEVGVQIQRELLDRLIDEAVVDLLVP